MIRRLSLPALALVLLAACSSSKPAVQPAEVDPATDPSIIGAVDEAALQGTIQGEAAARTGRRIGRVAGVLAAVFGGPSHESLDDTIDRYRDTRDAIEVTSAIIGTAKGATEGAKRGYQFDLQFAELHEIEGLQVFRPMPDQIEVRFISDPTPQLLSAVAAVFADREPRAIEIEGAGDAAFDVRHALIERGVPAASFEAYRDDNLTSVYLRFGYRD